MGLASRMRDRITLERYEDEAEAWMPMAAPTQCWAEVTAIGQEQYRVAIRWRADLHSARDAEPAVRVLWDGHTLDVLDVTEAIPAVEVQLLAKGRQIEYDNLETGARRKTSWP
jgi:hypothetical protein